MSREILFRGRRSDNGEWVEGYYVKIGVSYILPKGKTLAADFVEVDPSTVGQNIKHEDDKGKEIFEGDLVLANDTFIDAVVYGNGGFIFAGRESSTQGTQVVAWNHLKVIGTVHDKEGEG